MANFDKNRFASKNQQFETPVCEYKVHVVHNSVFCVGGRE